MSDADAEKRPADDEDGGDDPLRPKKKSKRQRAAAKKREEDVPKAAPAFVPRPTAAVVGVAPGCSQHRKSVKLGDDDDEGGGGGGGGGGSAKIDNEDGGDASGDEDGDGDGGDGGPKKKKSKRQRAAEKKRLAEGGAAEKAAGGGAGAGPVHTNGKAAPAKSGSSLLGAGGNGGKQTFSSSLNGMKSLGGDGVGGHGGGRSNTFDTQGNVEVFCGNLPYAVNDEALEEFFKPAGEVINCRYITDKETGKFYGSGFVEFKSMEEAKKAVDMTGQSCLGRFVRVTLPEKPRPTRVKPADRLNPKMREPSARPARGSNTAFLGNITLEVTDVQVNEWLDSIGCARPRTIRWLTNKDTGAFRGCGFFEFEDVATVDTLISKNGELLAGRPVRIDYA